MHVAFPDDDNDTVSPSRHWSLFPDDSATVNLTEPLGGPEEIGKPNTRAVTDGALPAGTTVVTRNRVLDLAGTTDCLMLAVAGFKAPPPG